MKLSVIIPVFNCAPWLPECLDSVLAAGWTWSNAEPGRELEIFCVDDGSTDGSGAILDGYASCFNAGQPSGASDFLVLHRDNRGVSAARNVALDRCTGDLVAFVDGDDAVSPEWFRRLAEAAVRSGAMMVRARWTGETVEPVGDDVAGVCRYGYACVCLYRREAIGETRFVEGLGFAEDTLFNLALMARGLWFGPCSCDGYFYRQREGSAKRREIGGAEWLKFVRGCEAVMSRVPADRLPEWVPSVSRMLFSHVGRWFAFGGERACESEMRECLKRMIAAGRLSIGATKRKYRFPLRCYVANGWRLPMQLLQLAIRVEQWRRKHMST